MNWKIIGISSILLNIVLLVAGFFLVYSPLQELNELKNDVTDICQQADAIKDTPLGGVLTQFNLDERVDTICS